MGPTWEFKRIKGVNPKVCLMPFGSKTKGPINVSNPLRGNKCEKPLCESKLPKVKNKFLLAPVILELKNTRNNQMYNRKLFLQIG